MGATAMDFASVLITAIALLIGYIISIVIGANRLAARLQRIEDAIGHQREAIDQQTVRITSLSSEISKQNGRLRTVEINCAARHGPQSWGPAKCEEG